MGIVERVLDAAGGPIAEELKGDFAQARKLAADADPTDPETRLALGLVDALAGNCRRAQTALDAVLPELGGYYAQLAEAMSEAAGSNGNERFPDGVARFTVETQARERPA